MRLNFEKKLDSKNNIDIVHTSQKANEHGKHFKDCAMLDKNTLDTEYQKTRSSTKSITSKDKDFK